jgi:hypothetical protein
MSASRIDRRRFLWSVGGGLGGVALAHLLGAEGLLAGDAGASPSRPRPRPEWNGGIHHPARARRVVELFMSGAASQCDMFDYKPMLIRKHGEAFDPGGKVELFQSVPGAVMKSPWSWKPYGECGKWMSDLVSDLGGCVDEMAFLPAMIAKSNVHGPATFMQNTGFVLPGFPSFGAWVSYGMGSLNENLPSFVVLPDSRGFAPNGPANWAAGFLPAAYQGTMVKASSKNPIFDLFPPDDPELTPESQRDGLAVLDALNRAHRDGREGDSRLDARIASYELAARLQLSAPEVLDIAGESRAVRALYGLDEPITSDFGRNCLVARRLLERGVRFVQVWSGADNGFPRRNWDSHEDIARDHGEMGAGCSTTRWSSGPPSSAGCRAARAARGAITTRRHSPRGWPAAGSRGASPTGPATSGRTGPSRTRRMATTSTRPRCTCSGSTTPASPSATTASTAGSPTCTAA